MFLSPGTKLAHYEILEPIGKGGMGEVYRARDGKLGRDVAIKVLPDEFAQDTERLRRFQREAKVLASLNHPNIASIYGLEQSGNTHYLVLELVPGETLAARLARGPIPADEAREIASKITEALEAAHEKGIVHRDLKPANIMLTPDDDVKVLDFGLAKAFVEEVSDADSSMSPTRLRQGFGEAGPHSTRVGVILGTAAYMSPEQAKGKKVDKRTDVWAFGAVLYEMLTGKKAFPGEDVSEVLASVIKSEPDWNALPANTSQRLRELLARCLEKVQKKRRRDIGDVRAELDAHDDLVPTETTLRSFRPWYQLVAAVALVAASIAIGWYLRSPAPRQVMRFEVRLPDDALTSETGYHTIALSPKGTHMVFVAVGQLYLRAFDQTEAAPIRGTERAREPFFSPDGEWIGFHANGYLRKVPLAGGTPVTLCETESPVGATWAADNTIVFGRGDDAIWKVSGNGGEPRLLSEGGEGVAHGPQKLPGGKALLFTFGERLRWDQADIIVERLDTGERTTLIHGGKDARYVPTGHLVYTTQSTLFAVPFDLGTLEMTGSPIPVVESVLSAAGTSGASQFSFSDDGLLAYISPSRGSERELLWVTRDGRSQAATARTGPFWNPRFSPNGKRVAVRVTEGSNSNLWILDLERDTFTQLTTNGAYGASSWSPDGEWLMFTAPDRTDIFRVRTDFSRAPVPVVEGERPLLHATWMPDGRTVVYQEEFAGLADIWSAELEGEAEPRVLIQTPAGEAQPDISPDRRFIIYQSDASGATDQIFIQPLTGEGARKQVSTNGGRNPLWSPTGKEIFYKVGQTLMSVPIRTHPELEIDAPKVLFQWPDARGNIWRNWDVAPNGERFVMTRPVNDSRPQINVILNWFDELERLVPTDN
ncbi:MAG: serine/threonine-protein kinase [Acidobacteria bacterium]|nr:MAG: serine/threonine-protein kinase [Acidobacteriota bacterium]